jgi:hypothetical protein
MKQLPKAIELLGTAVVLVLLAGIALVLLKANRTNDIVEAIRDAADWLATPFNDMFELDSRRGTIAVNWAVAAVVYYAVSRILAHVTRRG